MAATVVFPLCDSLALLLNGAMRFALFPVVLMLCVGCEKKPTPEEVEQKQQEVIRAKGTPTPKPGAWMKDYKGPLDKKPN